MKSETNQNYSELITKPTQLFPLTRHLSYRLTPILLNTSITPNQVTALSLTFGLLCAVCFLTGSHIAGIVGGLLLTVSYTFDNCDGEIARIKKLSSEFGARFDDMTDWTVDACFFAALGYGTSQVMGQPYWFWFGCAAAAGAFIDYIIELLYHSKNKEKDNSNYREELASKTKTPQDFIDWLIYIFHKLSRADFCLIVLGLALFNFTWILLPFAAIGAQIFWITDLSERSRGYHT